MLLEMRAGTVHEAELAYDTDERIFYNDLSGRRWESAEQLNAHFDRVEGAWKRWAGGRMCALCAGYEGFQFDMAGLGVLYRTRAQRALERCFDPMVRWGLADDPLLRTTQRYVSMAAHRPSHIYGSKDEAVAVLRGLRKGTISLASD